VVSYGAKERWHGHNRVQKVMNLQCLVTQVKVREE
jgi:hypothetical protein